MKHAIKIEDMNIKESYADGIEAEIQAFLEKLNYSHERIEPLECRSYDGFSAYSHNKGGLGGIAFQSQDNAEIEGTGFENADNTLDKYFNYDRETFAENNKLGDDFDKWSEEYQEQFHDYRSEDSESTVLFSCDVMLNSDHELNIRACVCVKDTPYHKQYNDIISIDITFDFIEELNKKLNDALKDNNIKRFACNVSEAY